MFDCPRCDRGSLSDMGFGERKIAEPWCADCRKKHRDEYAPVYKEWFDRNAGRLLQELGVPSAYQACTFSNFDVGSSDRRRVLNAARLWPEDMPQGLFLCGAPGTGKTHLAVSVLLALRRRHFTGRFASVRELLIECRDSFGKRDGRLGFSDLLLRYSDTDTLVLDDLGAENSTEFARETLGTLVDRAYCGGNFLIVTSNLNLNELAKKVDPRTTDRLVEMCTLVKFSGASYRQEIAAKRAAARPVAASEAVQ